MEYLSRILDLESEIERLKVSDEIQLKYMDVDKRYRELDNFSRKISEMVLNDTDRRSLMERVSEYKDMIDDYRNNKTPASEGKRNVVYSILSFLFGLAVGKSGKKIIEMNKAYKEKRTEEMSNHVLDVLREVLDDNEKRYKTST